jgi:L-threonylcarbamoyladenylate synthase
VRAADVAARATALRAGGNTVGLLALRGDGLDDPGRMVTLATPEHAEEYARILYGAMRRADVLGLDVVLAVPPPARGIGVAVVDRLRRAAASS